MKLTKDIAFGGIEDYFPPQSRIGAVELARRLERLVNSLVAQLRSQPTLYTNAADDPPEGHKVGDVWINPDGTVYVFDGESWIGGP